MADSIPRQRTSFSGAVKALIRPGLQGLRSLSVHADHLRQSGQGPLAIFLPAYGPSGAARLRIFNVARDLRAFGWQTLVLPPTLNLGARKHLLARFQPDVVVMQGARHALNRPVFYPGVPIVFDMDDADFHLRHLARPVRDAMEHVAAVAAGSRYIADWCRAAGAGEVEVIWTGSPVTARPRPPQAVRGPVLAWAQTRPQTYVHEAEFVRQVTARLAAEVPGLVLRLYDRQAGDDPSFADSFRTPGLRVEWLRTASYSDYLASFDDVALGLAPLCPEAPFNRGKSFGKVLAYLDREVPVLASVAGEFPAFFTPGLGVMSNAPGTWVSEGARLLGDPAARQAMAHAARAAFERQLSARAAATRMNRLLRRVSAVELRQTA